MTSGNYEDDSMDLTDPFTEADMSQTEELMNRGFDLPTTDIITGIYHRSIDQEILNTHKHVLILQARVFKYFFTPRGRPFQSQDHCEMWKKYLQVAWRLVSTRSSWSTNVCPSYDLTSIGILNINTRRSYNRLSLTMRILTMLSGKIHLNKPIS